VEVKIHLMMITTVAGAAQSPGSKTKLPLLTKRTRLSLEVLELAASPAETARSYLITLSTSKLEAEVGV
jgi:hypothetical protein